MSQKARKAAEAARLPRQGVCEGTKKSGGRCGAFAMAARAADGRPYCAHHHPTAFTAEQRKAWAMRGGLVFTKKHTERKLEALTGELPMEIRKDQPDYKTAAGTRAYLEKVSAKVEHGEIAPSQAGAIAQIAGLAIKLAELQNERDLLDMELEAARDRGGRR